MILQAFHDLIVPFVGCVVGKVNATINDRSVISDIARKISALPISFVAGFESFGKSPLSYVDLALQACNFHFVKGNIYLFELALFKRLR